MSQLLRGFYRIFFKNKIIRWAWMLGLSVWGVKWASENFLKTKNTFFSKTILSISPEYVAAFTIRKGDEETTFARADSVWLVVKNDVTIRIPADSVAVYLNLFSKMTSYSIKKLSDKPDENTPEGINEGDVDDKALFKIFISKNNNTTDSLSIFYTAKDSVSGNILTYIKLPKERLLHGVEGNWVSLFDKDFNDFRNAQILSFSRADVSKVTVRSRLDTVTFYAKDTANWTYSNDRYLVLNDSFNTYLKSINHLSLSNMNPFKGKYYDASREFKDIKKIENQLVIFFKEDSATLTAYRRERSFILHSTQNPDNYFQVDSVGFIFQNTEGFVRLKKFK